ncbi:MAG: hypothetical protein ACTH8S_09260, partial [Brachybacterium sp.]
DGVDDAVVGQVEDRARSIALRTSILVHRLVVLWDVDVLTTPITAGPRAVLRQRRDAPHHHQPGRAPFAQQLQREGRADAAGRERLAADIRGWAEHPDGWFCLLHGEVVARVP